MPEQAVHPGKTLKTELDKLGVTSAEIARQIGVPPNRISMIINEKRSITGDTALRLGHWFRNEPQFWLNLQNQYDLAMAERDVGDVIRKLPKNNMLQKG
ncbi:addiction module HigA family antidote [Labrenzia sp. MBR-25]